MIDYDEEKEKVKKKEGKWIIRKGDEGE